MRYLCERAGVIPFGFHSVRRYVASVLTDRHKISAKRIQEILRHQNLSTTELYISRVANDVAETVNLLGTSLPLDLPLVIKEGVGEIT